MNPVVPKPTFESGVWGWRRSSVPLLLCDPSKNLSLSELEVPCLGKERVGHDGLLTDCCCGMLKACYEQVVPEARGILGYRELVGSCLEVRGQRLCVPFPWVRVGHCYGP